MKLEDGIKKVLNALAQDPSVQVKMKNDPDTAVKDIVGDDLTSDEVSGLVKGTGKLFGDAQVATGFMGLLGVQKCIPGLATLLTQKGGVHLLMNYITGGMNSKTAGGPVQQLGLLSELLSSAGGANALIKLIGRSQKGTPLPDLTSMLAMQNGSGETGKPKKTGDSVLDALTSLFGPK